MGSGRARIPEGHGGGSVIAFWVPGIPVPQGSPKIGRRWERPKKPGGKGRWKAVILLDSEKLERWRNLVHAAAARAVDGKKRLEVRTGDGAKLVVYDGPVIVWAQFVLPRIKGKPRWGDVLGVKPDLDKLQRALGDALETAGVVSNDSRICGWPMAPGKIYGDKPGVNVLVETLEDFYRRGIRMEFAE